MADGVTFSSDGMHQIAGQSARGTPFLLGPPFTISTRVKWDIWAPYNYILEFKNNDGNELIRMGPWGGNRIHYGQNTPAWEEIQTTTTIQTGVWYVITVTHSGSEVNIYIDGVLDATKAFQSPNKITRQVHRISTPHPNQVQYPQGESTVTYIHYYDEVIVPG